MKYLNCFIKVKDKNNIICNLKLFSSYYCHYICLGIYKSNYMLYFVRFLLCSIGSYIFCIYIFYITL